MIAAKGIAILSPQPKNLSNYKNVFVQPRFMFFIYHPPCPCGRNAPQRDAATIVLDCKDGVNEVSDSVAASLHRHHWEKPK